QSLLSLLLPKLYRPILFPYTTLFRSFARAAEIAMQTILELRLREWTTPPIYYIHPRVEHISAFDFDHLREVVEEGYRATVAAWRSEEHTSELQSRGHLVCRLLLVKKN